MSPGERLVLNRRQERRVKPLSVIPGLLPVIPSEAKESFGRFGGRQSTQNAYKADFVDSRNKKMAATVEVTAIFSLALFTIQTSKVPAEGNMM